MQKGHSGLKPLDAVHLASASVANVEEMHTFDKRLIDLNDVITKSDGTKLRICRPSMGGAPVPLLEYPNQDEEDGDAEGVDALRAPIEEEPDQTPGHSHKGGASQKPEDGNISVNSSVSDGGAKTASLAPNETAKSEISVRPDIALNGASDTHSIPQQPPEPLTTTKEGVNDASTQTPRPK
jgi:hypothetical protein